MAIKGIYRDVVFGPDGMRRSDSGWRANRIVDACHLLTAALMKGEASMRGVLYLALGTGREEWDAAPPTASPRTSVLEHEVLRVPVAPAYEDTAGLPGPTISSVLRVGAAVSAADLPSDGRRLREFGLVGGDATSAANSGYLIDYVIHPRINLDDGFTLARDVRLCFGGSGEVIAAPARSVFGGDVPVRRIDGVGSLFGSALEAAGVATVGDLAERPVQGLPASIPQIRALEFRAKARLVVQPRRDPGDLLPLGNVTMAYFLGTPPATLAASVPGGRLPAPVIAGYQEELGSMQVALDSSFVRGLLMGDYIAQSRTMG